MIDPSPQLREGCNHEVKDAVEIANIQAQDLHNRLSSKKSEWSDEMLAEQVLERNAIVLGVKLWIFGGLPQFFALSLNENWSVGLAKNEDA